MQYVSGNMTYFWVAIMSIIETFLHDQLLFDALFFESYVLLFIDMVMIFYNLMFTYSYRFQFTNQQTPEKYFWIWVTLFKSHNDIKAIFEWNLSEIIVKRQLGFVFYLNYLRWRRTFFIVRSYGKISFIGVDYMPFDCVVWNVHNSCGSIRLIFEFRIISHYNTIIQLSIIYKFRRNINLLTLFLDT